MLHLMCRLMLLKWLLKKRKLLLMSMLQCVTGTHSPRKLFARQLLILYYYITNFHLKIHFCPLFNFKIQTTNAVLYICIHGRLRGMGLQSLLCFLFILSFLFLQLVQVSVFFKPFLGNIFSQSKIPSLFFFFLHKVFNFMKTTSLV